MALEGLNLLRDERQLSMINTEANYPDLKLMLDFISTQQPEMLNSAEQREGRLLLPSKTYLVMVKFLMKCFEASQRKRLLEKDLEMSLIEKMGILIEKATVVEGSNELHATASRALVDIASHFPKVFFFFCFVLSHELVFLFFLVCVFGRSRGGINSR
jgi:proteasome component ECM29